ncbi:MAG: cytochrome c [bacterium]|nr:cytochrome c [bacterium]
MARFSIISPRRAVAVWLAIMAVLATSCSGNTDGLVGQDLFERTCAVCHGGGGEGSANRPALNQGSDAATLTDEQIRGVISVGPGAMPSFASRLSKEQVDSLIEYLRQLQAGSADED